MSLFEDTNPRELKELLAQIQRRESALPDFQRDFVWDPSATQELIVSIANNYPAGSLLRIRNTHDLFACREFQGAPELKGAKPTYLVLDGQQRQTSLYQAFYGVGDHRYFVRVEPLLAGADFEECIFHVRATHRRAKRYATLEGQAQDLVLPLSVLKDGSGGFLKWSLEVAQKRSKDGNSMEFLTALTEGIGQTWIQRIDDYRFPVVTLSDETTADAVCTIFETLNRTGVRLSAFELLTARFWPKSLSLRTLWTKARAEHPIIETYDVDPYYVLQVVSLVAKEFPACKRSDVLGLDVDQLDEWWERATWGMDKALEILRDDCGVLTPAWIPYETMLIPLAGVLAKLAIPTTPDAGASRQKLVRWFWCSTFGQTYENSGNTQAARDITECVAWLTGGDAPAAVRDFKFDPRMLRDTTPRQRAMYKGAMALSLRKQPRDFYSGAVLTRDLIIEHNVDDHHVFPQGFLNKQDVAPRLRDCILNRTLIDRKTNIRISDRAPSDYMTEVRDALKEGFPKLLESHHLPAAPDSPLWKNDFGAFLDWREDALWAEIREVTGLKEATDLLDEEVVA